MKPIRQFMDKKTYVALGVGAVVGLALGLLIGWWIWPVEWTNSTPASLRSDFQDAYVMYVVENYEANGTVWATEKLGAEHWDEKQLAETFGRLEEGSAGDTLVRVRNLRAALAIEATEAEETEAAPVEEETGDDLSTFDRLRPFLLVCGVALVVAAIVGGVILLFGRKREGGVTRARRGGDSALGPASDGIFDEPSPDGGLTADPQAQFVTSYSLGDDHYDPSFSIELETGEFMGECGVGISDTLSAGEPSKVTAFEIWLFDKNDIRTVTKVLMSEYAFGDDGLRTKLSPKGEPILAKIGDQVILETKRLRVQARLLDLAYGGGDLPMNSYFSRLTLDLTAWVKPSQQQESAVGDETPFV